MRPDPGAEAASLRSPGRFILHHVRRWRWHFGILLAAVLAGAACGVGQQYGLKLIVDATAGPRAFGAALGAMALFLGLVAAEAALTRLTGWLTCVATIGVGVDVRAQLFAQLSGQPMRYFAENLAGSLGQRVTATAGNMGALANTLALRVAPPLVDLCGALAVFGAIDWRLAAATLGFVGVAAAALVAYGQRGRPIHGAYSREAAATAGDLVDTIANMWTVKAFSARAREASRLERRFREEAGAQRRSWMYLERARLLHDLALWGMAATVLPATLALWAAGAASPGDVVMVAGLVLRIMHGSKDMAHSLSDLAQQFGFVEETLSVVARRAGVADAPGAPGLVPLGGSVELRGVSFAYLPGRPALDRVSLAIPAGQTVGIVGPSGAGKSTLAHLLQRLYDPDAGDILLDGQPLRAVTQDSLRDAIAVVPQEIGLLNRSIRDNIAFARPGATEDEILAAARAAACLGFVSRLPDGLDTIVGERGARLSGGQRQRIGIARAFLKDAPVILLDEATSALDTETELEIQGSLTRLARGRTVISVAHRLSTLAAYDRILVVEGGRVVEDGSVAQLLGAGGTFDRMWRLQAAGPGAACEGAGRAPGPAAVA